MNSLLKQNAEHYFAQQFGLTLNALLVPVDGPQPAGKTLRGTLIYRAIEKARRLDDPSIPMGLWEHELKRADWSQVCKLTLQGLQQSKDMQLVAWLLEAQIHQQGLRGIAPCLILMQQLCSQFWDHLYPPVEEGDLEYRANIIRWIAEKLLPALHLIPLIDDGKDGSYNWSHWEQAQRNEQLKSNAVNRNILVIEGITWQELYGRINATPTEHFQLLQQNLLEALQGITELSATLDQLFGADSPSMNSMATLLQEMQSFVAAELHKRGVKPVVAAVVNETAMAMDLPPVATPVKTEVRTRAEAYATLAETAEFLMRLEPHSPVPYLVRRATEWGRLDTVELYQELFLRLNGQLNIFEMLGIAGAGGEQLPGKSPI
jgi:type VI secretion system protein ImpA